MGGDFHRGVVFYGYRLDKKKLYQILPNYEPFQRFAEEWDSSSNHLDEESNSKISEFLEDHLDLPEGLDYIPLYDEVWTRSEDNWSHVSFLIGVEVRTPFSKKIVLSVELTQPLLAGLENSQFLEEEKALFFVGIS